MSDEIKHFEVKSPVSVHWIDLSSNPALLSEVKTGVELIRLKAPDTTPSNLRVSYMSPWKSHHLVKNFEGLVHETELLCKRVSKEFLKADLDYLKFDLRVTDCWVAVYEQGDEAIEHHHFPSDFSAVLYLDVGEGSAPIVFGGSIEVRPQNGTLLIFPGILLHLVPPSADRRVVVAMNLQKFPKI